MNLDDLEKQWEDGDDEEELKTEDQAKFERLEKRRKIAEASTGKFDPRQACMCILKSKRAHFGQIVIIDNLDHFIII